MMNKRTYVSILTALVVVVVITSCNDLLNQTPRGQQTAENFFVDSGDALEATNATYQIQRQFNFGFQFLGITDIASDNAVKGSTPADGPQMRAMDEFTFDDTNPNFVALWRSYYDAIFRANQAITNIPDIDMDESLRSRLVGENKFLRAYYYFFFGSCIWRRALNY